MNPTPTFGDIEQWLSEQIEALNLDSTNQVLAVFLWASCATVIQMQHQEFIATLEVVKGLLGEEEE